MKQYHLTEVIIVLGLAFLVGTHLPEKTVSHAEAQVASSTFYRLTATQQKTAVDWISTLQYKTASESNGAIPISDGIAVYEKGTDRPLRRVVPYFAHLGILGVLDSNDARRLTMTKNWITWYLSHIDQTTGVPLDTWYSLDGAYSTTCPVPGDISQCAVVDAEDSSVALFFVILDAYVTASGDKAIITTNSVAISRLATKLVSLIDTKDGLSFAKKTYPVKYTLDNSEVYAGLLSLERLNVVSGYTLAKKGYFNTLAIRIKNTLVATNSIGMTSASSSLFYWAKDGAGTKTPSSLAVWYPDSMAQYWPYLFGVVNGAVATSSYQQVVNSLYSRTGTAMLSGDCVRLRSVTGNSDEPSIVYALYLKKDMRGALLTPCMYTRNYSTTTKSFIWPFHVGQVGWLLRK